MDLIQKLLAGSPHFVRCIKPNDVKQPAQFDKDKVLDQLRYTGVLETIKIRREGFSHRIPFAEFLRRYGFLGYDYDEKVLANRESCRLLLVRLQITGYGLGQTKVFLRYYHVEYLSKLCEAEINKIIMVQAMARKWLAKKRYERERWRVARDVSLMNKYGKTWLTKKRQQAYADQLPNKKSFQEFYFQNPDQYEPPQIAQDAAVLIQKHIRGYLTRSKAKVSKMEEGGQQVDAERKNVIPIRERISNYESEIIVQPNMRKIQANRQRENMNANLSEGNIHLINLSQQMAGRNEKCLHHMWNSRIPIPIDQIEPLPSGMKMGRISDYSPPLKVNNYAPSQQKSRYQVQLDQIDMKIDQGFYFSDEDDWDIPYLIFEFANLPDEVQMKREVHIGNIMREELQSQLKSNMDKENNVARKWWGIFGQKQKSKIPSPSPHPQKQRSASIQQNNMVETETWWQRTDEERPEENARSTPIALPHYQSQPQLHHPHPHNHSQLDHHPHHQSQSPISQIGQHREQQGPFHFRHMLKPISRNGGGSTGSSENSSEPQASTSPSHQSSEGQFDFRHLLRKTDNAPTDTLRKCKGMLGHRK